MIPNGVRMRKPLLLAALAAVAALAIAVAFSSGSSHREAPGSLRDPLADWTDTYFFTPESTPNSAVVVGNVVPFLRPEYGPIGYFFDEKAHYYVNYDNTGDGRTDVRYQFVFETVRNRRNRFPIPAIPPVDSIRDLAEYQRYDVYREEFRTNGRLRDRERVVNNALAVPANIGTKTIPDYQRLVNQGIKSVRGGGRVFAGPRDDAFFIDLGVAFDSVNLQGAPSPGPNNPNLGTGNQGGGTDTVSGNNVLAIVLELPEQRLTRDRRAVTGPNDAEATVGAWTSTERRRLQVTNGDSTKENGRGGFVQVNRLGNPLINELIIGIPDKDKFNQTQPQNDVANFGGYVVEPEIVKALNALFSLDCNEKDRTDLVQLITGLPGLNQIRSNRPVPSDTLKLNLGTPPTAAGQENRFGVIGGDTAGYPNGRRLGDDVVDITLRVACDFLIPANQGGQMVPLGDGVDRNDVPFLSEFPYESAPIPGNLGDPGPRVEPTHPPTPGDPTGQP